ncbi:MAG TPA: serine hydrolase domain-containing protein [Vicinamibacterales bacterium]|nr:serine hydrolase domain-containing protein [Vicinamibacterales bacterium]
MSVPRRVLSGLILVTAVTAVVTARQQRGLDLGASAFEGYIELLRQTAGIPGLSGVLIQDGSIVWERGLGFADVEARIPARPDTPYVIGDLTEPFTAVLVLQCDERKQVDINREITNYGGAVPNDRALVKQVLSHTSTPPGNFKYEPARYAQLTGVVEYCSRQTFRKSIALDVLDRLAMARSVPGRDFATAGAVPADMLEKTYFDHYRQVLESLAVPYKVDKKLHPTRTELAPEGVNAATGLVSTVRDLAQFDFALDDGTLLRDTTLARAWSAAVGPGGAPQPTGLGWFVQNYRGVPLVWQYGMVPNAYSGIVLKIPSRRVTMILLANSDGLVNSVQLEAGDVTRSPFASVLLRMLL